MTLTLATLTVKVRRQVANMNTRTKAAHPHHHLHPSSACSLCSVSPPGTRRECKLYSGLHRFIYLWAIWTLALDLLPINQWTLHYSSLGDCVNWKDKIYPSLNGKRLDALQFCFTLYQLLFPCWHCTRRHAAAAPRDSILNPSGQIRAFVIPKSNLIFVKAQNSSDKTLLKIAVVLFSVDNKINDEPGVRGWDRLTKVSPVDNNSLCGAAPSPLPPSRPPARAGFGGQTSAEGIDII